MERKKKESMKATHEQRVLRGKLRHIRLNPSFFPSLSHVYFITDDIFSAEQNHRYQEKHDLKNVEDHDQMTDSRAINCLTQDSTSCKIILKVFLKVFQKHLRLSESPCVRNDQPLLVFLKIWSWLIELVLYILLRNNK